VSGVAAAALLAISLLWHSGMPASRPSQNALPAPSAAQAPANVDAGSGNSEFAESQAGWLSGFGDDEKSAGSFVPLSQTFDPASVDDDTVVRVVLSRAALDSFGLHLADDAKIQAGSQVVADLIVTNDGTPQAIRVVGW
jgi:hypothetical protein